MRPRFYVFSDSHPCEAVLAAARHKGIAYDTVDLPPVAHAAYMRATFGRRTVPGLRIGDRKVQGTSAIFRALDELEPARPLFPADPALRRAVEEAEAWGAGAVQDIGRRLVWFHFLGSPEAMRTWVAREERPGMRFVKKTLRRPAARMAATANRATPDRVRTDLAVLPALLDRIDALITRGVIGDPDAPNAADFQLLSSVGVWSIPRDIRPAIVGRPCGEAMLRMFPRYDGDGVAPGVAPAAWLAPLRASIAEREAPAVVGG